MTIPQLKPPAPYYGGKTRLAPWIVSLMRPHGRYIEPFMGTCSVLLAKPQSRFEVINDLDGDVVNFFRVLRDQPEQLERACRLTPYARDEFHACRDRRQAVTDDVERARRWWVRVMQGFNNAPGDWCNGWSISARRGTPESRSAQNTIRRFEAIAERIVEVAIENAPALHVIQKFDDDDAVIYCDPPYLGTTRTGRARREQVKDYAHDMLEDDDHRELAAVLRAARGHVLLSGYDSPLYEELYDGWWRVESSVVRVAANHHADTAKRRATEVVWSNRPLIVDEHLLTSLGGGV